jgi:hypothetical protein
LLTNGKQRSRQDIMLPMESVPINVGVHIITIPHLASSRTLATPHHRKLITFYNHLKTPFNNNLFLLASSRRPCIFPHSRMRRIPPSIPRDMICNNRLRIRRRRHLMPPPLKPFRVSVELVGQTRRYSRVMERWGGHTILRICLGISRVIWEANGECNYRASGRTNLI